MFRSFRNRLGLTLAAMVGSACSAPPAPSAPALGAGDPGTVLVEFVTERGPFTIEVDADRAPRTSAHFLEHVQASHYDGGQFHRSVRLDNQTRTDILIEVVQARARALGAQEKTPPLALESTIDTGLRHVHGTVSMARGADPDTAETDFFIVIGDQPELDHGGRRNPDGLGFAAFGRVRRGMSTIEDIHRLPTRGESLQPPIVIRSARRIES